MVSDPEAVRVATERRPAEHLPQGRRRPGPDGAGGGDDERRDLRRGVLVPAEVEGQDHLGAVLAQGTLISHEHATTGTAKLIRLPDGSHTLRLEHLDTSNGPDLRVSLTDAPGKERPAGWTVFDDGKYVSLGKLKGNKSDQNHEIPADVNLADFSSVTVWCDRFGVSFGAAALTSV
ncbi:DM13 domain-containing protein [Streptomyces sp. NBC_01296]|uniref:DM13 domain-containing protein n=1 Tax=Streptomyces sp. NBC_01296 TaxID=2903816 RepID=UPI003FA34C8D